MKAEYIPLKPIPVPDYDQYKTDLCGRHSIVLPLKEVPFAVDGNLKHIPAPVNREKTGWPWTIESEIKFSDKSKCPKLSVVIPSYQQGLFIEEAIRSVLLQNYPNLELIVMDGGSDDETTQILEYYNDFISISISEKDRGQSHAINKGFSVATGELYYWLNSDDYLNLNSLNHAIPYFLKDNKLDIVYGHGLSVDADSGDMKFDYAPFVLDRYLRVGGIVFSHSVIWRKHIHCPIWEDLHCAMDAELWMRLFLGNKATHCQFPIGIFRKHPEQKTSMSSSWEQQWKEDYEKYIWKYYPPITQKVWHRRSFEYNVVQKIYRLLYPYTSKK